MNCFNMPDITTLEIEKLQKQADKYWNKYIELSNKIKDKKLEVFDILKYEGKYIKYGETYLKVESVMRDPFRYVKFDFCYVFRGLGFCSEFTGYHDATFFDWSYWYEKYIYGDFNKINEKFNNIVEITEEEFDAAFEKCLKKLKTFHYK